MTPNEIKSQMILKGIKQTDIAAKLGILRSSVSGAISGKRPSKRVQVAIAKALGLKYKNVWGDAA